MIQDLSKKKSWQRTAKSKLVRKGWTYEKLAVVINAGNPDKNITAEAIKQALNKDGYPKVKAEICKYLNIKC